MRFLVKNSVIAAFIILNIVAPAWAQFNKMEVLNAHSNKELLMAAKVRTDLGKPAEKYVDVVISDSANMGPRPSEVRKIPLDELGPLIAAMEKIKLFETKVYQHQTIFKYITPSGFMIGLQGGKRFSELTVGIGDLVVIYSGSAFMDLLDAFKTFKTELETYTPSPNP